jgi:FMNH2-dependent dimethyl sulfone monooxygenase
MPIRTGVFLQSGNMPNGFPAGLDQARQSTSDDGFRTPLIGTPEQIAQRIAAYRKRGVDLTLGGFLPVQEEVEYFGTQVLPLVREREAAEQDSFGAPLRVPA